MKVMQNLHTVIRYTTYPAVSTGLMIRHCVLDAWSISIHQWNSSSYREEHGMHMPLIVKNWIPQLKALTECYVAVRDLFLPTSCSQQPTSYSPFEHQRQNAMQINLYRHVKRNHLLQIGRRDFEL